MSVNLGRLSLNLSENKLVWLPLFV